RSVAICREVGDYDRGSGAPRLWLHLPRARSRPGCDRSGQHVRISDDAEPAFRYQYFGKSRDAIEIVREIARSCASRPGRGPAGLAAVIKIAEMGGEVDLFSIVPVKRSHSVCAQGGINAAKNLKGEGD